MFQLFMLDLHSRIYLASSVALIEFVDYVFHGFVEAIMIVWGNCVRTVDSITILEQKLFTEMSLMQFIKSYELGTMKSLHAFFNLGSF